MILKLIQPQNDTKNMVKNYLKDDINEAKAQQE